MVSKNIHHTIAKNVTFSTAKSVRRCIILNDVWLSTYLGGVNVRVNLSLCSFLNGAPRHEGVLGNGGIAVVSLIIFSNAIAFLLSLFMSIGGGGLSPGVKRSGRGAGHSPVSSAGVD